MNTKELIESGYTIENAKIASADLIITENYIGVEWRDPERQFAQQLELF